MAKVFVSYRREDSEAITGRLCDRLKQAFGSDQVFVDIDDIPLGKNFVELIRETLKECQIVLVVIGRKWPGRHVKGRSRLEDPNDFVRMEMQLALSTSMAILPILVAGARMPAAADLPEDVRAISNLNAAPLDAGRDFHQHADKIISAIGAIVAQVAEGDSQSMNALTPLAVSHQVAGKWFDEFTGGGTAEVEYKCKSCGFTGWIEKPNWFRDDERPPSQCPKCGAGVPPTP